MSSSGLNRIGKLLGLSRRQHRPGPESPRAASSADEAALTLTTQPGEQTERAFSEAVSQPVPGYLLPDGYVVAGRHVIQRAIGRGGMGEVYQAHDLLLNELVALKTLRAHRTWDLAAVKRFQTEIQLARKVTHPNVCRVFEAGLLEGSGDWSGQLPFFIMELLPGETLAGRIRRAGRMSSEEAIPIAVQMAQGLQAAHAAGIVHADFKSGNVILVPGTRAVITDFGLSRIAPVADATAETQTLRGERTVEGTLAYMSPEQISGRTVTPASDIFSFGVVLYEMATARLPFDERQGVYGAMQRAAGAGLRAPDPVPGLDERWNSVISRCLQTEPKRRFASAGDIAAFLEGSHRRLWTRREWATRGAALAAAALAAGGYWLWSHRPYEPKPAALEWYRRGVAALHSMTYETARKTLEQAVAADPGFALAHANLARAYQELYYSELAKESMLRATTVAQESHLSSHDQLKLRATHLLISRDYARATPLFRELEDSANRQDKPAAALEYGWLAQQRDDTGAAAEAYERALSLDPSYPAARLRLGYILGRRRKVNEAVKAFEEAETAYSTESNHEGVTECLLQKAMLLNRSGRSAEAMPVIESALTLSRAVGSAHQQIRLQLARGIAIRNLGDPGRARSLTRTAIDRAVAEKMDSLATSGLVDLGNSFLIERNLTEAEPLLLRARELAARARVPRDEARAQLALGSLYEQKRRPEEALRSIQAAIPFYRQGGYLREFVQATLLLGRIHTLSANFDQGIRVLREVVPDAVKLQDPRSESLARDSLADNLRHQSAWPEALAEYQRAAALAPDDPASRLRYAELCWKLGRRQDALLTLSQLESQLKDGWDRIDLRELLILQTQFAYLDGRFAEAAALARQTPSGAPDLSPRLTLALVRIRTGASQPDISEAASVIDAYAQARLSLEAAGARLDVAEALMLASNPSREARSAALEFAREAAAFYDPRRIWEASWRVHWAAARAAGETAESQTHWAAARAALLQLKQQWPAEVVGTYMKRPEISRLLNLMTL